MKVEITQIKNILVVSISGELDDHTAPRLREAVETELDKGSANKIVLDCTNLEFMDSSGLGVILGRYKRLKSMDGNMVACNLNPQVDKIFELSGLKRIIQVYSSAEEALNHV